ncbi:ArsR/SmtB family transcription factor [Dermacoccaceae bacterium W4C1]
MEDNRPQPEMADRLALTEPGQVRAIAHPLRTSILQLLHERPASVTELAQTLERPKSTIAHHVKVLADNGLLQVVGTRKVRAVQERFYARTARMFYVASTSDSGDRPLPRDFNDFEVAAAESGPAFDQGRLWAFIRHARLSPDQVSQFWSRMAELVEEFDRTPRSGDTGDAVYGFAVGVYPTDRPSLPPIEADQT